MSYRNKSKPDVVYVDRGEDASAKWLFMGAVLGAGLALMYAPRNGEETRRSLQRKLWQLRAMAEEKLDELTQRLSGDDGALDDVDEAMDAIDEETGDAIESSVPSPRQEVERRLAEARARRQRPAELEEPLA